MKANLYLASIKAGRINRTQIRLAIAAGTLMLLALGAGAPAGNTGF